MPDLLQVSLPPWAQTYDEHVLGNLVLLRHGQSTWNELNLFTGWHDVPLSAQGEQEAAAAGPTMAAAGLVFDVAPPEYLRSLDAATTAP